MRNLMYILLLFTSFLFGQDLVLDLKGTTYKLPSDFQQQYDNIKIINGTIESDFPEIKELDLDDYENIEGVYVVSKGAYNSGGSYPAIIWNGIYTNWGSLVEYRDGKWSNWNMRQGFRFKGDLYVENVAFKNIPFFLFDPIGRKSGRKVEITNSSFTNVRRVIADTRGKVKRIPKVSSLNNKTVQDGTNFNFERFEIVNSEFDLIHSAILWGSTTIKYFIFNDNIVKNSPNIIAVANLLPVINTHPENIRWYIENSSGEMRRNLFKNIVNHSYDRTAISRVFFRINSNTHVENNRLINVNGMFVRISGGGNILINNYIEGYYRPTKKAQSAWFVHKHAHLNFDKNYIVNNTVARGNQPFFAMIFSNDYDLIGNDYTHTSYISEKKDKNTTWRDGKKHYYYDTDLKEWKKSPFYNSTRTFLSLDRQGFPQNLTINSINNKIRSHLFIRMLGEDGKMADGQSLFINSINDTLQVNHKRLGKNMTAKELNYINATYKFGFKY